MSRLSLYLPPFAADYSGASSVLFPFDCMVVILDAGCCSRSYAEYDEPRWDKHRKASFSAQLRTLDTVVGDETSIVTQIVKEARSLEPKNIALLGTPVPAVVAMDIEGMAFDVEERSGIPCFGIDTNGFDTYEQGASAALVELFKRYGSDDDAASRSKQSHEGLTINMLGVTPLDMPDGAACERWKGRLQQQDVEVAFDGMAPFGSADVAALSSADANLVMSWSGLALARALEQRYGVPYVCGIPFDEEGAALIEGKLRSAVENGRSGEASSSETSSSEPKVLLVGDQIFMNELRGALVRRSDGALNLADIVVMSFFGLDPSLSSEGDRFLAEDIDLEKYVAAHPGIVVVGDALLSRVTSITDDSFVTINHPAVSGSYPVDPENGVKEIIDEIRSRARA